MTIRNFTRSAWAAFAIGLLATTSLAFAGPPPKGTIGAYLWSGDAAATNALADAYSYNAVGKRNTVKKTGTGRYEVKLPSLGTAGGHAQVSAYGSDASQCKPVRWNQAGSDQIVQVACFNATGAAADSQFSLL